MTFRDRRIQLAAMIEREETGMTETLVRGLQVVVATKGRERQFWVAVSPRIEAVAVVQKRLEDGWKASLTSLKITLRQAHELKLRLNSACRWDPGQPSG